MPTKGSNVSCWWIRFGCYTHPSYKYVAAQLCYSAKLLLNTGQPYKKTHIGMFISLCLPQLWYMGWNSQAATRKAQAWLNGSLGRVTALAAGYIVVHPELSPNNYPAFINPNSQELSSTGNVLLMADIQWVVRWADPNFHLPTNFDYKWYQAQHAGQNTLVRSAPALILMT